MKNTIIKLFNRIVKQKNHNDELHNRLVEELHNQLNDQLKNTIKTTVNVWYLKSLFQIIEEIQNDD